MFRFHEQKTLVDRIVVTMLDQDLYYPIHQFRKRLHESLVSVLASNTEEHMRELLQPDVELYVVRSVQCLLTDKLNHCGGDSLRR